MTLLPVFGVISFLWQSFLWRTRV